jgi:hypothetical protein
LFSEAVFLPYVSCLFHDESYFAIQKQRSHRYDKNVR